MSELDDYLESVFDGIVEGYKQELDDVISNPRYWGQGFGTTRRKNGEIVSGGFRNIVDTQELKNSQSDSRTGKLEHTFEWDAGHATIVHEGTRNMPPRPWTRVAAQNLNIEDLIS